MGIIILLYYYHDGHVHVGATTKKLVAEHNDGHVGADTKALFTELYAENCDMKERIKSIYKECGRKISIKTDKSDKQLKMALNTMNPIIVDDKRKMLFCPVLKCGSTTILELLTNSTGIKMTGNSLP